MWAGLHAPMDWRDWQDRWPHASHSRFVELPEQRWHVQVSGQGPVLLLLHGTGASSHSWRDLVPVLEPHCTVVRPDLPGHAFSPLRAGHPPSLDHIATSLCRLLDRLGLWPAAIAGHSAGAAVAARLMLDQPDRPVPLLIGLNPAWLPLHGLAAWLFPPSARLLALNPLAARLIAAQAARTQLVRRLIEMTGSHLDAAGLEGYRWLLQSAAHVQGVLSMMAAWNLDDLEARLGRIRGAVRIHLGGADRTVPGHLVRDALARMPQAQVLRVPGLGHLAHEEQPVETAATLLRWLAEARHPGD